MTRVTQRIVPSMWVVSLLILSYPIAARRIGETGAQTRAASPHTRVCETPGPLLVESILYRSFALYVYVPQTTREFDLGLKCRNAGASLQKARHFQALLSRRATNRRNPGF